MAVTLGNSIDYDCWFTLSNMDLDTDSDYPMATIMALSENDAIPRTRAIPRTINKSSQ